ncbi:MAG TPA: phosphodiester glycosidase family protein [Solirubrobacterales bacterium]|nr:phosphodiester glycosidase family protein [Solirubrobacterales bacterium]
MPIVSPSRPRAATALPRPLFERRRLRLADGAETTIHVARFDRDAFDLRVAVLDPPSTVQRWCRRNGAEHAIVGGFYMRPGGPALGDLWVAGRALPTEPFDAPWHDDRACVHIGEGTVRLAARRELGADPTGDLLHAGPMLVGGGRSLVADGADGEGFSAGARQFDSDITAGRYPRAALGLSERQLIAAVCDGRADDEAGLTMEELAQAMIGLGAAEAINLDGGGSASLVVGGSLVNTPREEHGIELVGGRSVATALHFAPRLTF